MPVHSVSQHAARSTAASSAETALSREQWFGLSALTLLGAALRIAALGRKSFWLDELSSIGICTAPRDVFVRTILHHEGNMALYYLLLRPWLSLGTSEASVRLFSAIAGVAAIPMMYFLARRIFSPETSAIAAALLAVSPCAIVYSQEARGYSLLVLFVLASTYAFVCLVERPSVEVAVSYGVLAALMMYCHFFGALVIVAQFASLAFLPKRRLPCKALLASVAVLALLGWPVVWMVLTQDSAHLDWVPRPSLLEFYHLGIFLAGESGKALGGILLAIELVLLFVFLRNFLRSSRAAAMGHWKRALVVSGLLTPILITLAASAARPIFFHRFLIICLPFWVLMVAGGLEQIGSHQARRWILITVTVLSMFVAIASYSKVREDWRSVTRYLGAHIQPDDILLCYRSYACPAIDTYAGHAMGKPGLFPLAVGISPSDQDWKTQLHHAPKVWLVRYPSKLDDETVRAAKAYLDTSYDQLQRTEFQSVSVTEYTRK